jgi:hypothetical protein
VRVDGLLCFVNIHIGWTLAELCCEWTWRTASLYLYVDELSDIVITMRTFHVMVVIVILFALNVCSQSVVAQPTQASYAVNLTYVSVLLTYPSEVLPGDYYGYGIASCPSYLYNASTDSGVAPLSYIKAATPEYQVVQQQLSQSQAENQQLKQDLQSTIAQKNSVIADLNQQLSSAQSTIGTLEFVTAVLAGVAIVLGIFTIYRLRGKVIKQTDETENKP